LGGFQHRDLIDSNHHPAVGFRREVSDARFTNRQIVRVVDLNPVTACEHDAKRLEGLLVQEFLNFVNHGSSHSSL
jgi:hypothetical protein